MKYTASFTALFTTLLVATGCPDDSSNSSQDGNKTPAADMAVTTMDMGGVQPGQDMSGPIPSTPDAGCVQRCVAKGSECGAPVAAIAQACESDYCAGPVTQEYIACLESTACTTLGEPDDILRGCNKPCFDYPSCDGNSVTTCSYINGAEVTESSSCGANSTCSGGECKQNACIMSGKSDCNALNNPSNCCDDRQTCFGDGNGGATCCAKPDAGCDSDSDCCFADAAAPAKCVDKVCVY